MLELLVWELVQEELEGDQHCWQKLWFPDVSMDRRMWTPTALEQILLSHQFDSCGLLFNFTASKNFWENGCLYMGFQII
jgi:hypothetical protein